ncbi:hypothetical protein H4R26_002009, partial [Coemansia thaxteri]
PEGATVLPGLNCLELRVHPQRGRGVSTRLPLDKGTLVHISPVLLFDHAEYKEHGRHTKLDHYTYCWQGGYALALGLGSLFSHEPFGHENVGFTRDMKQGLIKYTALRDIAPGEELCICCGQNVWFDVATGALSGQAETSTSNGIVCTGQQQQQTAESLLQCFDV